MRNAMLQIYVKTQTEVRMKATSVMERFRSRLKTEDEGSFLTENLGVVAITVALIAIVLIGFTAIIGETDGTGGTGVLGTMTTRITDFFNGNGVTPTP